MFYALTVGSVLEGSLDRKLAVAHGNAIVATDRRADSRVNAVARTHIRPAVTDCAC